MMNNCFSLCHIIGELSISVYVHIFWKSLSVRRLRQLSDKLAHRMRISTRTKSEGGAVDPLLLLPSTRENKAAALTAARSKLLEDFQALDLPSDSGSLIIADEADLFSHTVGRKELASLLPTMEYKADETVAYAASRAPGCFAAAVRVLSELRALDPSYRPDSVLDFASGPGSSLWAVDEVFGLESLRGRVVAVEPSKAMREMAQQILSQRPPGQKGAGESGSSYSANRKTRAPVEPAPRSIARGKGLQDVTARDATASEDRENELVRWMSRLPYPRRGNSSPADLFPPAVGSREGPPKTLVLASYFLNEVPDPEERRKIVLDLWNRTGDVLVLIESGSPYGFSLIREARWWILELARREARRFKRLRELQGEALRLGLLRPAPLSSLHSGDTSMESKAVTALPSGDLLNQPLPALVFSTSIPAGVDPRHALSIREALLHPRARALLGPAAPPPGAHVVAPCPGDGACPIDGSTENMYCHFKQRFERPELMRLLKAGQTREPHVKKPRGYQDERFSFVILRKGPRPGSAAAAAEPPARFVIDQWTPQPGYAPLRGGVAPSEVVEGILGREGRRALAQAYADSDSDADGAEGGAGSDAEEMDHELDLLIERVLSGRADPSVLSTAANDAPLVIPSEPTPRRGAGDGGGDPSARTENVPVEARTDAEPIDPDLEDLAARDAAERLALDASRAAQAAHGVAARYKWSQHTVGVLPDPHLDSGDIELETRTWLDERMRAREVAGLGSADDAPIRGRWPRVVRPPQKATGHVLLDVCRPPPLPSAPPGSATELFDRNHVLRPPPNVIRRYTVAKSTKRVLGLHAYRGARQAMWGDLFPPAYLPYLPYWEIGGGWARGEHRHAERAERFANLEAFAAKARDEAQAAMRQCAVSEERAKSAEEVGSAAVAGVNKAEAQAQAQQPVLMHDIESEEESEAEPVADRRLRLGGGSGPGRGSRTRGRRRSAKVHRAPSPT